MEINQVRWMFGGAMLLVAVSVILAFGGAPSVWAPMPLPIVLMALLTLILFPFVTPVIYMLVLKYLASSAHFTKYVLGMVAIIGFLNILYFQSAWEYGLEYQGSEHTKIVAAQNTIGFILTMAM